MSDKRERKAQRKALIAKKLQEEQMKLHPEWCYCEEVLHKEADIDWENDMPIGQTEPVDGFPHPHSKGFTQDIYRCKRCGKQYCVPIAFASSAQPTVEQDEEARKALIGKLIEAASNIAKNGHIGKGNYISIPEANLQHIADGLGISREEAIIVLKEYFEPRLN
jgi:hypothetical protein